MRRRISFRKRILAFEALEQKRPLAVEVLSCGEADPDSATSEEGSGSQHAAKSADLNQLSDDGDLSKANAAENEVDELENEKSSNGLSRLDQSAAGQLDEESDEADDFSSDDDDDDAMMDDDSDEEENESDEEDDESDDNDDEESDDEDSDDEDSDDEDSDDESDEDDDDEEDESDDDSDDGDESEEEDDDDVDDEEDQDDDDSDEEEDDSEDGDDDLEDEDEDDQTDDDDESDENDNDSGEDDQDELGEENDENDDDENEADVDAEPMQSSVERREAVDDDSDELTPAVGFDVAGRTPAIIGFPAVENGIQRFRSVRLSDRQLVDEDLIELLQIQPGNPSRDGRELVFDEIVALANIGIVEPIGPFINDVLNRAALEGPVQPALIDAVFESLDQTLSQMR